jgi:chitinase
MLSFQAPTTSTSASSDTSTVCTQEGFVRDPNDLGVFYRCVKDGGQFTVFRFECPAGLVFDTSANVCNWKYAVAN